MAAPDPSRWKRISPYLDQALTLPEDERARWLAALRQQDPALADDLQNLLEKQRKVLENEFLEERIIPFPDPGARSGVTIGAYRLLLPIGQGGMSTVWLAERSDGRFERQVAVKFLSIALYGRGEERFKREGSILGRLTHPHIAQLMDAGVSASGEPYLVLEYVEGQHIDRYCDERRLDVEARVRLFLDVIAAVVHAHANLVVHRDIKPSNVLVTDGGQVKLLDFGIAKLLEDEAGEVTLTREGGGALTPQYAAPEQLQGGAVTTATDVYALGVLLYLLLTGRHPAGNGPHSPAQLMQAIIEKEAMRPSDAALSIESSEAARRASTPDRLYRQLRGDLDTIIGKALKKSPADRYASVAALADDLQRYLKHEPISARPDTVSYRAGKFIRRNRTIVAVTAAALSLVMGSLSAGLYVANRERKTAERRFTQVRHLANKFLDLDEGLRGISGSTKIRNQIVSDSLQYLSTLGDEVHGDEDLALEIAIAYVRVAHVQGDPTSPNLGQFEEAETSLRNAQRFVDMVLSSDPQNHVGTRTALGIAHDRMILADRLGHADESLQQVVKAAALLDEFIRQGIESKEVYGAVYVCSNIADGYLRWRRMDDAVRYSRRALEISQRLPSTYVLHGSIYEVLGDAQWQSGNLDEALKTAQHAVELQEKAAANGHAALRANLADALQREGMILGGQDAEPSLGRTKDALAAFQKALNIAEDLASKDSNDYLSRGQLAAIAVEIGNIVRRNNPRKALVIYDHALSRVREAGTSPSTQHDQAELLAASSYAARWAGRQHEAKQRIAHALQLLRDAHRYPAEKIEPMSDVDHAMRALADGYAETGESTKALEAYQELLDKLMAWNVRVENDLRDATCMSRTWAALASLMLEAGQKDKSVQLFARRADVCRRWRQKLPNNQPVLHYLCAPPSKFRVASARSH
jgi:serine/threonine protein kinase